MTMAGAHWIPVDTPCADPASPSAFDGVVYANDDGAIGHEPFDHEAEQSPGNGTGAPAASAELVACKVGGLGPAGHAQARADGSLARRQQSSVTRTRTCSQLGAVKQVRNALSHWRRICGTASPTAMLGWCSIPCFESRPAHVARQ